MGSAPSLDLPDARPGRRPAGAVAADAALCRSIECAAAAVFAVPLTQLRAPTRGAPRVALARQAAMYLAHVTFALSHRRIATLFRRERTTVAHACRTVEDRRDEVWLEARLRRLEAVVSREAEVSHGH